MYYYWKLSDNYGIFFIFFFVKTVNYPYLHFQTSHQMNSGANNAFLFRKNKSLQKYEPFACIAKVNFLNWTLKKCNSHAKK